MNGGVRWALAIGGCAAAIAVLVSGRGQPPLDFTLPWAVIPIPGFLIGFWAADRYGDRFRDRSGWRRKPAGRHDPPR
jgi:peptidoglycan/LPS O-acetylase OafA/YrhL